jgi:dGTPase
MAVELDDYDFFQEREVERANVADPRRDPEDKRSPFERDRSRLIHSIAFRRLQGKTQIFEPQAMDYVRSRLTHSVEVAQIGRGLAKRFQVPGSLVEAACLGHDVGHPPFGHTGEAVLNEIMKEHGGFEGNAQTFRVVTRIEAKHKDYDGLDLCRATLLALIKYPFRRTEHTRNHKFLYHDDVLLHEEWLYKGIDQRLLNEFDPRPPRTLPCQLMDWADDIAYSVHDLEDGIASGLLRPSSWRSDFFKESIYRSVTNAPNVWVEEDTPTEDEVEGALTPLIDELAEWEPVIPLDLIREVSRDYIDRFVVAGEVERMGDSDTLFDYKLGIPRATRVENQVLKAITIEYLLRNAKTAGTFYKGREILNRLFEALWWSCREAKDREKYLLFPRRLRTRLKREADNVSGQRREICDYLASLTEGQARQLYSRWFEPSSGFARP